MSSYYCNQCFDSNINGICPLESCERRFKETGSYYRMFDPKKPVQTRGGRKARIICTDLKGDFPMVAVVEECGEERIRTYKENGSWGEGYHDLDLVNVPVEHEGWVNIYSRDNRPVMYSYNKTREEADQNSKGWTRLACVHIKFKEGEGL